MKTILAAIDFSKATASVIDAAAALATAVDARIVLLHVVQPLIINSDYGIALDKFHDTIASSEKYATTHLARLRDDLKARGIPQVKTVQISGPAQNGILEQAKNHTADFIVMGSHGHTAIYDLLIGSTTQQVLRKAPCPVMIVPRPAA